MIETRVNVSRERLDEAIDTITQAPTEQGRIEMVVSRPAVGLREVLQQATLTVEDGMVGDTWPKRWSGRDEDRQQHLEMQIALMNSRVIDVITEGDRDLWPLAGDQFFVDFDLSEDNLPTGTKIQLGEAVLEVTPEPHLGCSKFSKRFGRDAVMFVNAKEYRSLKLRGVNARVVRSGVVTSGGVICKLASV